MKLLRTNNNPSNGMPITNIINTFNINPISLKLTV